MFDFEFDENEDSFDAARIDRLVASYEAHGSSAYFDSESLDEIALYYFEHGRFDSALTVLDRLLEVQPFSSDLWLRKSIVLKQPGPS